MDHTIIAWDAVQQSGTPGPLVSQEMPSGCVQPPLPSAVDTWPIPMVIETAVVSGRSAMPVFGTLYAAGGSPGNVGSTDYWLKRFSNWYLNRVFTITGGGSFNGSSTSNQNAGSLMISASGTGTYGTSRIYYPGQPGWATAIGLFGEGPNFIGVDPPEFTTQAVDTAVLNWGVVDPTVPVVFTEGRSGLFDIAGTVTRLRDYVNALNFADIWAGNTLHTAALYMINRFPGPSMGAGTLASPIIFQNADIDFTTVNPQLVAANDFFFDGQIYRDYIGDIAHPGSPFAPLAPPIGRTCVNFGGGDQSYGWSMPDPSFNGNPFGVGTIIVDRVQVRPHFPCFYEMVERSWIAHGPPDLSFGLPTIQDAIYRRVGAGSLNAMEIAEIPQPVFIVPFITGSSPAGNAVASNMDVLMLINQSMEQFVGAQNAFQNFHSYIVQGY